MVLDDPFQRGHYARLHFRKRLAFGESETGWGVLYHFPSFRPPQDFPGASLPLAHIRLKQTRLDLDLEPARVCDGHCRLDRALQRTGVDGGERRILERLGQFPRLFLSARVQVDTGQVSREFSLFGVIVFAVTDEEEYGHVVSWDD